MKYRVLRVGDRYFPQYKSWWTFGWKYFKDHWLYRANDKTALSYTTEESAVNYCEKLMTTRPPKPKQVVWEYRPENNYFTHTGQE